MAFDGFTTAALARELSERLTGGRIYRIIQPEQGELLLTIRPEMSRGGGQVRLVLSADATLPLVYLTRENKPAPETAPAFCMLLRKHLQNGRIVSVTQPGLERILRLEIEHYNEMGDLCRHTLVIELMGKHSNIILTSGASANADAPRGKFREGEFPDAITNLLRMQQVEMNDKASALSFNLTSGASAPENLPLRGSLDAPRGKFREGEFSDGIRGASAPAGKAAPSGISSNMSGAGAGEIIVDAIKHIPGTVSSVREVLPGRSYFVPQTQGKRNPFGETQEAFLARLGAEHVPAPQFLLRNYNGFSTRMSEEVVFRSHLSQDRCGSELSREEQLQLWSSFRSILDDVEEGRFTPTVYYHVGAADALAQGEPVDYAAMPLTMFRDLPSRQYDSISDLIANYYREKNAVTRIRQKSADLRRIVQTILERDLHKYDLQAKQLRDTQKRDQYRLYGELLNVYGYGIPEGAASAQLDNYYTGEKVVVPLDPTKSASENAQHYYERYTKLKRTREALEVLMQDVKAEIDQLKGIRAALDLSVTEADLAQIREEMEASGFLHRHETAARKGRRGNASASKAQPLHYLSSDGYDIYVGKNNLQNDDLTFHFGRPSDIWFHANDMPGSHVLLRTNGTPFEEVPDRTFEEAARLAAYYSTGRDAGRVEVDYLERRNVKKPSGARPGFVVYYTNYSINVRANIAGIRQIDETDARNV